MKGIQKTREWFTLEARCRIKNKIKWINQCAKGFRIAIIGDTLLGSISSLIGIGYVLLFRNMVDIATGTRSGDLFQSIFLIAGALLIEELLSAIQSMIKVRISQGLENQLKREMFDTTIRSRYEKLIHYHSGDLMNRLDRDTATIVSFLTVTIPGAIICFVKLCAAFFTMLFLDAFIAFLSIIALPAVILLVRRLLKRMKKLNQEFREISSKNTAYLQETFQNIFVVKAFEAEKEKGKGLFFLQEKLLGISVKRNFISVLSGSTLSIGFSLGYFIAFLTGAFKMMQGKLTFGTVSAFLQLISQVQGPLYSLAGIFPALVSLSVASERLMELVELEKEPPSMLPFSKRVRVGLEGVTFEYEEGNPILVDVSCEFEPGEATAIIGKTGEGKTTLIRLLLGFLRPKQGIIYLENGEERIENGANTRANYTYVPQGNTILSGTVRDNLFPKEMEKEMLEEEIEQAIFCACAEFLYKLPNGLDTVIGERGIGLSEGQGLRLAIVRALLRKAPIMIFDESTAALDEKTQSEVFFRIRRKYQDRTLIFITHKLSMANVCDKILQVKEKKVCSICKEDMK